MSGEGPGGSVPRHLRRGDEERNVEARSPAVERQVAELHIGQPTPHACIEPRLDLAEPVAR